MGSEKENGWEIFSQPFPEELQQQQSYFSPALKPLKTED
jgi:hypothetical protein